MSGAFDDYIWNVSIAELSGVTFCAFFESFCFGLLSKFRHDPRMRWVKDRPLGVFCAVLTRAHEAIAYYEIFLLLKCTSVHPAVGYVAIQEMMTVDWSAIVCLGWFLYS